jgi:hypothetical protein
LVDGLVVHRGTGRLVAFFAADHEAMVANGVVPPGRTVFVDGTIRERPDAR